MNTSNHASLEQLELGDIRVLVPDLDEVAFESENRLVTILYDHRKIDGTLTVVYVDKLTEIATDRDFILTKNHTEAKFDLALWTDFTVRVKENQLIQYPRLGKLDSGQLKKAENFASLIQDKSFYELEHKLPWKLGKYVPFYGDKVWARRSKIMDSLNSLGVNIDEDSTIIRFMEISMNDTNNERTKTLEIESLEDVKILMGFGQDFARAAILV